MRPSDPPLALGRAMVIVGLVAGVVALAGLPARATDGARTSGDEPQYLLTATSLASDGDLDIADEVATGAYLDYHEVPIDRQAAPRPDGRRVSPHDPLLPVLLAGPMAVGGWVGAKMFLAGVAAVTAALTLWTAVRRLRVSVATAAAVTVAAFAGIPLAAYGGQIYPEMPAALALLTAAAAITGPPSTGRARIVLAMVAIVALPWLAVKYVPIAAAAGLALTIRLLGRPRALGLVLGAALLAAVTYLLAHRSLYGGWTVYASGDHFSTAGQFSVVGTDVDPVGRARRLSGLLVDGTFGLAVWSPIWLLLPPAVGWTIGRARNRAAAEGERSSTVQAAHLLALALLAVTWLNATFVALTMHGWWVPGRQLVVGLPIGVLLIAGWIDGSVGRLRLAAALGALGAVNWLWLAIEASIGRRTLIVDFAETGAPGFRFLTPLMPDGIRAGPTDAVLLALWSIAIVAAMLVGFRSARRRPRSGAERTSSVMVRR